jgi:MFS family permease
VRRGPLVLLATSLAAFTANLDNTVVAVALRDLQADLGSSVLGLQGVVTAYTVTLGALLLAGGAVADRLGAQRTLVLGVAVFAGASALCASAGSVTSLVVWRAVQGGGAALLLPAGLALLAQAYPEADARRRAVGTWVALGAAALVAGPVVGGELVARHGWPAVFWVNVPLCALTAGLLLPAPSRRSSSSGGAEGVASHKTTKITGRGDLGGTALGCLVLAGATYAVVRAGRHGVDARTLGALAVAAVAAVLLPRAERRAPAPLLPADVARDRRFSGALLATFAGALAAFVLLVFVSLFLQLVTEHDARAAGHVLLPLPVALVLAALATRRSNAVRPLVLVGLGTAAVALAGLATAIGPEVTDRTVELWLILAGAGIGLSIGPVASVVLEVAGRERQGLASAAVTSARELGGVVAVAGLGALAVSRLAARLTTAMVAAAVPADDRPAMLDALLRADTTAVRRQLVDAVGALGALRAYSAFRAAATDSFVTSTQWVLGGAALLVLALAPLSSWLLRERSD